MNNIRIEKVLIKDAAELLGIYGPYVRETAISFEQTVPSEEEFAGRIRDITKKYPYIKAVREGKIIGYAYAGVFKARMSYNWSVETTIYVTPEAKGQGVGKLLYEQLEKSLRGMGIINMNACIAVPRGNDPYLTDASSLFHKYMGYEMVGVFHQCASKFGRWYDMIWMEKMIGEHKDDPEPVRFGEWDIE